MIKILITVACISQALASFELAKKLGHKLENVVAKGVDLKSQFNDWKSKYDKKYTIAEDMFRFGIWVDNYYKIQAHMKEKSRSYTLSIDNQFGDMTTEEFKLYIHGTSDSCYQSRGDLYEHPDANIVNPGMNIAPEDLPESVDWSTVTPAVVTPVKNQGQCGATESQYAIHNGNTLNSLSEQELVDCSGGTDGGCNGGNMDNAFHYILQNDGLALETDYKYTAKNGKCQASNYKHYDPLQGTGFNIVQRRNATALASALALVGPVSIGIEADQTAFQFYKSGVLTGKCGTSIDHGVLAVGYGVDGTQKYWKVKNSWGTSWGEDGYVRICRECGANGDDGECCILCQPSYPTAKSSNDTKANF